MGQKMKNSGIEWVGDIPNHWKIERMKACIALREGGVWGEEETGDNDTICLRVADFDYDRFVFKNTSISALTKRHYRKSIVAKLRLLKGDIVIEKSGGGERTPVGRAVIFDKDYVALFANFMDRLRCGAFVYPKFMLYIFATFYKNQYTRNYIKQTTGIQNLDLSLMLNKEHVPMPPLSEQKAIAEFLDKKCGEVDALIADIQQEIETLEQYKRSVITESVTKGLDPSVPMKDSGIDWVQTIPKHWSVHPLYYYFEERKNKNIFAKEQNLLSLSYGKIIRKDINASGGLLPENFNAYNIVEPKDIVLRLTDLQNDRRSLRTGYVNERGIITSAYITLKAKRDIIQEYFYYELHVFDLMKGLYNMGSGVRQGLNFDELSKLKLFEPSIKEQEDIVIYIKEKEIAINKIIADKQSQIETLESYKKSLIYEYVTGKKEVE